MLTYDQKGNVLNIDSLNDNGVAVVNDLKDYKGKACNDVVSQLVIDINNKGYFNKDTEDQTNFIIIRIEKGSVYVSDEFLNTIATHLESIIKEYDIDATIITISEGDLNEDGLIGQTKAKELLLKQLGLDEVSFTYQGYQLDKAIYEFKFTIDDISYEYKVDAKTEKVFKTCLNDDYNSDITDE